MSLSTSALPAGLAVRPLTPDDARAVTALLARCEDAEPSGEAYDLQDIQEELTGPSARLAAGSLAVVDGEAMVAYGLLHVLAQDPEWVVFVDGAVDPRWRRRGIGRWIIEQQVGQAAQLCPQQPPGPPIELRVTAPDGHTGALRLLTEAGFVTRRWFQRMTIDLAGGVPARPPEPSGVRIRPWRPADDERVRQVSNLAFADHFGSVPRDRPTWASEVTDAHSFRPGSSFVAETDGVIVGFALAAEFEADSARRGRRTGYLSRVGTLREVRGRGIASLLVARVLSALREDGVAAVELDVDSESPTGAGRLYARLGFVPDHRKQMMIRSLTP